MSKPTLIIMAAGMGSRYGGLKQIDPITEQGDIIMDFSLYDAMMAGFERVIFVIKEEMEEDFKNLIMPRAGKHLEVNFAFQKIDDLPKGYQVPEGRVKPWGTSHAILCCKDLIDGPFAVINADDYYGPDAFHKIYDFLAKQDQKAMPYEFAMVGYELKNTITENGHVARGVCQISKEGYLTSIAERTKIMRRDGEIAYTEDEKTWHSLPKEATVSMNFWGYSAQMIHELEERFSKFLDKAIKENPMKGEYLIPTTTDEIIKEGKATVKVLLSKDKWYGVTYKEDKDGVKRALQALKDKGVYPENMW